MRKKERQLGEAETLALLQEGEYGVLSTVGPDGFPYGVPLSYAFAEGCIWLHSAVEGHKVDNLAQCERVSFCVVGPTQVLPEKFSTRYASAIVFGRIHLCAGEEQIAGLLHLVRKYAPEFLEEGRKYAEAAVAKTKVYRLDIARMSGKARKE